MSDPVIFIVFDFETTGLEPAEGAEVVEVGAVPIIDGRVREDCVFTSLVDPGKPIPDEASRVHGITTEMVGNAPRLEVVLPEFLRYCGGHPLVAHNAPFDLAFLRAGCERLGLAPPGGDVHDTLAMSRRLQPNERRHSLGEVCRRLGIEIGRQHRSVDDVLLTARVFMELRERLARVAG